MPILLIIISLLVLSNIFMTYAWYGHLKTLADKPWFIAALVSWLVAFFEYVLQVPANRIGATVYSIAQLKILQEIITLAVFIPFSIYFLGQPIKRDFAYAGLCMLGAVYFVFRK